MALTSQTNEIGLARVFEGRVTDVDAHNWTVDVYGDLTGKSWSAIQVGSPYLHYAGGDGISVLPEIGALCKVCVPSDTSQPFIMTFVAPPFIQQAGDVLSEQTDPSAGDASSPTPAGANLSANRQRINPGDMVWRRGRDGNFIILRKGGVLQLGGSELAQRIYLPLTNVIMDFSERYEHHNVGGSINWGMREGQYEKRETECSQTFRVYADDKFADIRVTTGGLHKPVPLPAGDSDITDAPAFGLGQTEPMVYEVTVVPGGFKASGELSSSSVHQGMTFLYRFDRAGNAHVKVNNFLLSLRGRFRMKAKGSIEFISDDEVRMTGKKGASFGSSGGNTTLAGKEVKIADGAKGAARVGDPLCISLGPIASILPPGAPSVLYGTVLAGSGKVKIG